jgi:hypothetical protein
MIGAGHVNVEEKAYEVSVSIVPDAIVDPGAVVV